MPLEPFTPKGFFDPSMIGFTSVNSYSTKGRPNNPRSVLADLIFHDLSAPILTLGHLNIHNPTADPLTTFKEDELATSVPYFNRATDLGYCFLNTPGVYTGFSISLVGTPGVIDLDFACPLLASYFSEWSDPLPSTGSDHIPILLRFDTCFFQTPPPTAHWALTDWGPVDSPQVSSYSSSAPPTDLYLSWDMV